MPRKKASSSKPTGSGLAGVITALGGGVGIAALIGVLYGAAKKDGASPAPSATSTSPQGSVEFTIYDRLDSNQISKRLAVSLDGRPAGTLLLDAAHRSAALKLSIAQAGPHLYSIEGIAVTQGMLFQRRHHLSGQGTIEVTPGKMLEPRLNNRDGRVLISLEEPSAQRVSAER